MPYRIELSPDAREHLQSFTAGQRKLLLSSIGEQLKHQPAVATRNRKPMRPNPLASWELRVGDFRVYYSIAEAPEAIVHIHAIGIKWHNRVYIAGKESNQ